MQIAGARSSPAIPADPLASRTNDLRGDPSRWRTAIPQYRRVRYAGVYPGIDLVYRAVDTSLEFDFEVAPGASPDRIVLEFDAECRLDRGDLVAGDARLHAPRVFQDGRPVPGEYRLLGARRAGFRIGPYDRRRPLLIDPEIGYSTAYAAEEIHGIATDLAGNIYIAGTAVRPDGPGCGAWSGASACETVFVARFDRDGARLLYATYLGDPPESSAGLAVDRQGNVYVAGTSSPYHVPTSPKAWVRKLDAAGSAVVYTREFGALTSAVAIAVNAAGEAYLAGHSWASDFPAVHAVQPSVPVKPVFVTADGGASWRAITTLPALTVSSLAIDPVRPSTLYVAAGAGFFKSADDGATWTRILPEATSPLQIVVAGGALYAVDRVLIAKSLDGGASWQDLTTAVPPASAAAARTFNTLAADPANPATLWLAASSSTGSSLFRSVDAGAHWAAIREFPPFALGTAIDGAGILVDPKTAGRVYLCCVVSAASQGIFRTDDNGATWVEGGPAQGAGSNRLSRLQLDSAGALYAAWSGGLVRSLDAGRTWTAIPVVSRIPYTAFSPGSFTLVSDTLLLVSDFGELFRSADGGATWTTTFGPWNMGARLLAAGPSASAIYIGSPTATIADAFAARLDSSGGVQWSTLIGGADYDAARSIALGPDGDAYVAGLSSSADFPGASGAATRGRFSGFITRIAADGSKFVYSTVFRGAADSWVSAVAVDAGGDAFVAGRDGGGRGDSFVSRIGAAGDKAIYTVLGGSLRSASGDDVTAIALRPGGVWVAGQTGAVDFPLAQPMQSSMGPVSSGFLVGLVPSGGGFQTGFSTYFGWNTDGISTIATAPDGALWIAGRRDTKPFFGRVDYSPRPPADAVTPEIRAVYNAASYRLGDSIAPGEIVTLFGWNFDNTTVTVGGIPAQVYYVGSRQINFVVPDGIPRSGVSIMVRRGLISAERPVTVASVLPGIFTVVHAADYSPVTAANPARRGEYLSIFCTGLGTAQPTVYTDNSLVAPVTYSGPAPGFPGLSQINIRVPDFSPPGAKTLMVSASSNQVVFYVE